MKIDKKNFNIVVLVPEDFINSWKNATALWDKYFEVNQVIDLPNNISNYLDKSIDLLFLHVDNIDEFKVGYYKFFQENNKHFKYVVISNKYSDDDYNIYRQLADDIVYVDVEKVAKWKTLAILRRYWNTYSKPSTIIYGDIIADFVDNKISVNTKMVDLTKKETDLLRYLMQNKLKFIPKNIIFKNVWGHDEDTSRTLDQMIFKLKRKIGSEYFHSSRKKGYKFE
ncbi:MAG: winged helix-turn-helix domain-containing protein [Mycoplasmatales bacterium]|nr:winged helix-turn-helix domain-containing protein [Mycoplasmatales bacterium]